MKEYAIIVAGGSGSRMKSNIPKQFILLDNRPILMRTIDAFLSYSKDISIILVLPKEEFSAWKTLCAQYQFSYPHQLVQGGSSRTQSVRNGLEAIEHTDSLVAIHDGVRPLVRPEIISASFSLAQIHGSAVTSTRLKESIRIVDKDMTRSIDRSKYRSIQTPQTFVTKLIKSAYRNLVSGKDYTDDASVAEQNGLKISLFEGSYENIKITTPEDLLFAEAILKK